MAATAPVTGRNDSHLARVGQDIARLTDGELLDQFVLQSNEAAFEALLRRHGPMVFGVCRRTLRNEADAEDAFQATFLVLVRKAHSIRPRSMVGNWLYGVANNTALKARAMSTKRVEKEQAAAAEPKPRTPEPTWEQLQPVLDQELRALPDKYRSAVVLCDVEGKSLKEVALQLGCPIGTVGTRVARGRLMLARRLARQGIAPAVGAVALLVTQNAATAAVPGPLLATTAKSAALVKAGSATGSTISASVQTLADAVLKTLLLTKLKIAVAILLAVFAIGAAVASLAHNATADSRAASGPRRKPEQHRLHGTWELQSVIQAGKSIPRENFQDIAEWTFDCNASTVVTTGNRPGTFRIDATQNPNTIDLNLSLPTRPKSPATLSGLGIYQFDWRSLTICLAAATRPKEFASGDGEPATTTLVFQRKRVERAK